MTENDPRTTSSITMLPIFSDVYNPRGVVSKAPTSDWLNIRYQGSVSKLRELWRSNIHRVYSDHPLVQALKHTVSYSESPVDVLNVAMSRAPYVSKNLKFTTDFNKGSFQGHKIFPHQDNMIYSHSDYISPYAAIANWKDLKPLKCLYIDSDAVALSIPDNTGASDGFSAVSIDIPQMCLMYKGFKKAQEADPNAGVYGEEEFVGTYVLSSILESQADLSYFSAMMAVYYGTYEEKSRADVNYYIPVYGADFKKVATHIFNRITDTRFPYVQVLQNIPSIYKGSSLNALILPDAPSTIQVDWAMLTTRLKVINFLLDVGGSTGKRANLGFINQLKKYAREVRSSTIPYNQMSSTFGNLFENSLTRYSKL